MSLDPGVLLGDYEIVSALGAGGMGEVYRARDRKLGREVAIKLLLDAVSQDPERLARFEREARVLASLNHPNIATLFGYERAGDTTFLVMELVEGETLADRIARGPIPVAEAVAIFRHIAEGLEAAHASGVIHRDLKPANIKLRADDSGAGDGRGWRVKILDFGLAKAMAAEVERTGAASMSMSPTLTAAATQRGEILGTAAYMSPEQARGLPLDRRADVWAFGVCLYEALTGRRAFSGEDASFILASVLKDEPDLVALPEETPPALRRLLRRRLAKRAGARLRDIGDAALELERRLHRLDPQARASPLGAARRGERETEPPAPGGPGRQRSRPLAGRSDDRLRDLRGEWAILAFRAAGRAVSIRGGRALTLCELPPPGFLSGASWADDGAARTRGCTALALHLDGERQSDPLLVSDFSEAQGEVSPNGRFLAYRVRGAEGSQVYVRPFPDVEAGHWQVSTEGGFHPVWSRDGRELFYRNGPEIWAVPVETEGEFRSGTPELLFTSPTSLWASTSRTFDVSPDGQRFLIVKAGASAEGGAAPAPQVVVVDNWFEELKRLVPTR